MQVIKLTSADSEAIKPLFAIPKFMSVDIKENRFVEPTVQFSDFYHEAFVSTYLDNLKNYHAYGVKNNEGKITGIISFFESNDDASWFGTGIRNSGHAFSNRVLLDAAIEHNEQRGRFKFYTLWSIKHSSSLRRLMFSKAVNERYDYFDEFYVPSKHQCMFNMPWQILFNRTLLPVDTVVRCTFLKQKYRQALFNAGRL